MVKAVGIKQLKARLSEYIRLVKGGDTILVTEREEVVAEIRPARRQSAPPEEIDDLLQALADAGEITRPSLPKQGWTWEVRGLGLPEGTSKTLLDDLRDEIGAR